MNPPLPAAPPRQVRWWPLWLIALLLIARLVQVWFFKYHELQPKVISTYRALGATGVLALGWLALLSALPWRRRLAWLLGLGAAAGLTLALVRVRGVTGDMLPDLAWRWQRPQTVQGAAPVQGSTPTTNASTSTNLALTDAGPAYPQFQGPGRAGVLPGPRLARDWKASPPALLWRHPVGAGWAGLAVAHGRVVTLEQEDEREVVVCYELGTGTRLWAHAYPARFHNPLAGLGPRSTPALAGGRVFAYGATGRLTALDLATGQSLWQHDVLVEHQAQVPEWGLSCSPLVLGHTVVVAAGGANGRSLVAYRADTGAFLWGGGNSPAGYASPVLTTLAGRAQLLLHHGIGVAGHDPDTGTLLWEFYQPKGPNVADPVVVATNRVVISTGYGVGARLLELGPGTNTAFAATERWRSPRLKSKFANFVFRDGFLYGLDEGVLACVDAQTGTQQWKEGRYGHGQLLCVGDLLLVTAENGEVALGEPRPEAYRELTRFRALAAKTWNPPALAGDLLLVRNDVEAACYRLPVEAGPAAVQPAPAANPQR